MVKRGKKNTKDTPKKKAKASTLASDGQFLGDDCNWVFQYNNDGNNNMIEPIHASIATT